MINGIVPEKTSFLNSYIQTILTNGTVPFIQVAISGSPPLYYI
nr:MAG TPA: hypothetical protein [Caudoviricetes sp.]